MPSVDSDTYVEHQRLSDGHGRSRANSAAHGAPGKQSSRPVDAESAPYTQEQQSHRANGSDPVNNGFTGHDQTDDLPALQVQGPPDASDTYEPVIEAEAGSYDLVAPAQDQGQYFSLEKQSMALFSKQHLQVIFADPSLLLRFTAFISAHRPQSVPLLVYYLDALKAIRAVQYANAITEALEPLKGLSFTDRGVEQTKNSALEKRADEAFQQLVDEELPAYITHLYINVVSQSIARRITGTLPPHLREASEGLAEVFCLTDPSRKDNPIVFASEEFHRTTQYGMDYVLGRNCRFLQGPNTNQTSVRRLREAIQSGRQTQETFLNYRRDGSPFVNLLLMAPLCDSRGKIRYFIGAQVDVSGLVKDCTDMEALRRLLEDQQEPEPSSDDEEQNDIISGLKGLNGHTNGVKNNADDNNDEEDQFRALSEMFNMGELSTVRKYGGRMHTDKSTEDSDAGSIHKPRLLLRDSSPDQVLRNVSSFDSMRPSGGNIGRLSGKLSGVYKHYLLVRPYPSLRILFASPSQRVPGILQSSFLSRIGGSPHVREELEAALAEGRGVTAKIRWISSTRSNGSGSGGREGSLTHNPRDEGRIVLDDDAGQGRTRWIHCTPLYGAGSTIGVWMVVMVIPDEETTRGSGTTSGAKPPRMAPPVRMPQSGQRHGNQSDEHRNARSQPRGDDVDREFGYHSRQTHHASDQQRYNPRPKQPQQQPEASDGTNINVTSPVNAQTNPYFYGQRHANQQPGYANGGYAASIASGRSRANSIDGRRSFDSQGGESLTSLRIG